MRKKSKKPDVQRESNEPITLIPEDYDILEEYGEASNFLSGLSYEYLNKKIPKKMSIQKTHLKSDNSRPEDIEPSYESKPRLNSNFNLSENSRLPIIDTKGDLHSLQPRIPQPVQERAPEPVNISPKQKSEIGPLSKKSISINEIPEQLAHIASSILQNPDVNYGLLKSLREFSRHKNEAIVQLSLLTQLTVYKDTIPGYKIRPLTESEKNTKISKEVSHLRDFEQTYLSSYLQYINDLLAFIKKNPSDKLFIQSTRCIAELLTCAHHFNFSETLLENVIDLSSVKSPKEINGLCCNALSKLFSSDRSGELSLEAVKIISKLTKNKIFKCNQMLLKSLLSLRLKDELSPIQDTEVEKKRKKERIHFSKKYRKIRKEEYVIKKELLEASATIDQESKKNIQTETLKHLFIIYFRILKSKGPVNLLYAVFDGLAIFSHLISIDFFSDLLILLKAISSHYLDEYIAKRNTADLYCSIHGLVATFQILSQQESVLKLDLKDFIDLFYQAIIYLSEISFESNLEKSLSILRLVLIGFNLIFIQKKQVSIERVSAFVKRLSYLALYFPVKGVMPCLSMIKSIIIVSYKFQQMMSNYSISEIQMKETKYPQVEMLIDDEDNPTRSKYNPKCLDPDSAHSTSSKLWEISLLMQHPNPHVKEFSKYISCISLSQISQGSQRIPPKYNLDFAEMFDFMGEEQFQDQIQKIIRICKMNSHDLQLSIQKVLGKGDYEKKSIRDFHEFI